MTTVDELKFSKSLCIPKLELGNENNSKEIAVNKCCQVILVLTLLLSMVYNL